MAKVEFDQNKGYYPVAREHGFEELTAAYPVDMTLLSGDSYRARYDSLRPIAPDRWEAQAVWRLQGYRFELTDVWSSDPAGRIIVQRQLKGTPELNESQFADAAVNGIQLRLQWTRKTEPQEPLRFHAPAIRYSGNHESLLEETAIYMDDRLTFPLALSFAPDTGRAVTFARTKLASYTEAPVRESGQSRYLQRTDIGSIGCSRSSAKVTYESYLPYYEGSASSAWTKDRIPAAAYYPLDGESFELDTEYALQQTEHENFASAVFAAFKGMTELHSPRPAVLPFTLQDSIHYRSESLKSSYRELPGGAAGFFFHFDPRHGYRSAPSGFGASFVHIPHESYQTVLEYGFTGRQLNAALEMARREGGQWWARGRRVIDFFVDRCATDSGFMYTLFEVGEDRPFASFGDKTAPKLHYVSNGSTQGNYLRLMVEPALDLLTACRIYREHGVDTTKWELTVRRFAEFLIRCQNEDGSWYRAFEPDGTPLKHAPGFGEDEFSSKSGTAIPIMFLLSLWQDDPQAGSACFEAAKRAAEFVLANYVSQDYYQGGTLDNPNVVDKEAAQYVSAALYTMYHHTGEQCYLCGSERAAQLFVTWNYIWQAPTMPESDLHRLQFNTVGNGGINSIWGGGVVDIYSLFFIRELHELGQTIGEPFYCNMARWIAIGGQQVLSHPGDLMGFADIGMQPEGFGICNQGFDEGMIAKGDIWGTLGWIYSAGIHGLGRYLELIEDHGRNAANG